jgi:hypothetical protein
MIRSTSDACSSPCCTGSASRSGFEKEDIQDGGGKFLGSGMPVQRPLYAPTVEETPNAMISVPRVKCLFNADVPRRIFRSRRVLSSGFQGLSP